MQNECGTSYIVPSADFVKMVPDCLFSNWILIKVDNISLKNTRDLIFFLFNSHISMLRILFRFNYDVN